MRGAASLTTLILFISFAAALSILAYIVDFYAQQVLQGDVENTAESVAEFVSSQIRDAVASGAVPGVVALKKTINSPEELLRPGRGQSVAVCWKRRGEYIRQRHINWHSGPRGGNRRSYLMGV